MYATDTRCRDVLCVFSDGRRSRSRPDFVRGDSGPPRSVKNFIAASKVGKQTYRAALKTRHNAKNEKYERAYNANNHKFVTFIGSSRGPIHPEAQRLLYFIAAATTRQHMHYYTTDLKYETVKWQGTFNESMLWLLQQ
jgi:hypothetical protein